VRFGGLFLLIAGSAIAAGGLLGDQLAVPVFWGGFGAGFLALALFARRLRGAFGRLSTAQILSIPAAIVLEIVLIMIVLKVSRDPRELTFAILFVVGLHFAVFAVASGPLCLLVAALCCVNALLGVLVPSIPVATLWLTDGLIKAGVGIAMLRTRAPLKLAAQPGAS
jgi:hypothetical protein